MGPNARRNFRGFTLLELVLVMVVACLALAIVAPSLSRWSKGAQLRDAADQFVAITRLARARAVAESTTYRLNINSQEGTYQLTMDNGSGFVQLQSSWGRTFPVPEGAQLQL